MPSVVNGIAVNVILPGGWVYPQTLLNGRKQHIEGDSYEDLESRVLSFRLQHLDVVDPESASTESVQHDIREHICIHFPSQCVGGRIGSGEVKQRAEDGTTSISPPSSAQPFEALITRVNAWFAQVQELESGFVDANTAHKRAGICDHCPNNVRYETACGPCNSAIRQKAMICLGSRKTTHDANLKGCRVFGHLNRAAVWMDNVPRQARSKIPSPCWNQ